MVYLPDELLLQILSYLDTEAPSITNFSQEPSLNLTVSKEHSLKSFSLVSRNFRRVALPVLFQYARVELGDHDIEVKAFENDFRFRSQPSARFLKLVTQQELCRHVRSIVLYTACTVQRGNPEVIISPTAWSIWEGLFAHINPSRVVIAAPPSYLGWLTKYSPNERDVWAFDMPIHMLELRTSAEDACRRVPADPDFWDILQVKEWAHLGFNEGSSLKAYSTYEYYWKNTPSCLVYMLRDLEARARLRSVAYYAIFPLSTHVEDIARGVRGLHLIESLHFQLVPTPQSHLLDDSERIGKADLTDCWQEVGESYSAVVNAIFDMSEYPTLLSRVLISDSFSAEQSEEMDDRFDLVGESGWTKIVEGLWTRELASADAS